MQRGDFCIRIINNHNKLLIPTLSLKRFIMNHRSLMFYMAHSGFAACLSSWQFITVVHGEKWCLKGHRGKAVTTVNLEAVGPDGQGGWGVERKDDRMEGADEVMCLLKALQSGVSFRSCSWKPSGQLDLSHTKHTYDPFYLTSFLLASNLTFCPLFFLSLVSPPLSPLYHFTSVTPLLSFKFALSKKISYSLMHGSCREQCYLIFPWQPSLCFSRSHYSFGSNVLICQYWTHLCVK